MTIEDARAMDMLKGTVVDNTLDDCISRQATINAIANTCFWLSSDNWEELMKCINSIPPVNSQPKTGHWIRISPAEIYECSKCGQNIMTSDICAYKFCHGCGVKMVEPQEGSE